MAIYVDDAQIPYRGMLMAHMVADTSEELRLMARKLGLKPHWIQGAGTWREHYDISQVNRIRAIRLGAIGVSSRDLAGIRARKRVALAQGRARE